MRMMVTVAAGIIGLTGGAASAAPDATAKVSVQDLHFASAGEATAHCAGQPISATNDGGFSCPAPAGMAINEKGLPGTKTPKPATPK